MQARRSSAKFQVTFKSLCYVYSFAAKLTGHGNAKIPKGNRLPFATTACNLTEFACGASLPFTSLLNALENVLFIYLFVLN